MFGPDDLPTAFDRPPPGFKPTFRLIETKEGDSDENIINENEDNDEDSLEDSNEYEMKRELHYLKLCTMNWKQKFLTNPNSISLYKSWNEATERECSYAQQTSSNYNSVLNEKLTTLLYFLTLTENKELKMQIEDEIKTTNSQLNNLEK